MGIFNRCWKNKATWWGTIVLKIGSKITKESRMRRHSISLIVYYQSETHSAYHQRWLTQNIPTTTSSLLSATSQWTSVHCPLDPPSCPPVTSNPITSKDQYLESHCTESHFTKRSLNRKRHHAKFPLYWEVVTSKNIFSIFIQHNGILCNGIWCNGSYHYIRILLS